MSLNYTAHEFHYDYAKEFFPTIFFLFIFIYIMYFIFIIISPYYGPLAQPTELPRTQKLILQGTHCSPLFTFSKQSLLSSSPRPLPSFSVLFPQKIIIMK